MKLVFTLLSLALLTVCPDRAAAQSTEQLLLQSVGASSGQAVYATHLGINILSDAWMAKAYNNQTALQTAGEYEGGMKAMNDYLNSLLENGKGLSSSDQTFLSGIVEACQLVTAQITAFKGFVKTGEPAKAEIFETRRKEAQAKISTLLGIKDSGALASGEGAAGDGGPKRLAFQIIQSTSPNGKPGQLGKVEFVQPGEGKAFTANWTYDNGGTDHGIGVPYPNSGVIAVGFGPDVLAVAIYKRDGKAVSGRWSNYLPGSDIGAYDMNQGGDENVYDIVGGGTVIIKTAKDRTANVTWKLGNVGSYDGFAVADGDYLAAVSVKPGGKAGVAIYTANIPQGTATGRWTMSGATGAGEELYKLISASGGGAPAPDGGGAASPVATIKALAQSLLESGPAGLAKLQPDEDQIEAIAATDDDAEKLEAYADKLYDSLGKVDRVARPNQTEIHVFSGDDLPGGYAQNARHLKPGLIIYGFEFVEPGQKSGISYDGLLQVDGKWVMIPKMWRAFAE